MMLIKILWGLYAVGRNRRLMKEKANILNDVCVFSINALLWFIAMPVAIYCEFRKCDTLQDVIAAPEKVE